MAVELRSLGKVDPEKGEQALVSHDSHRGCEKACGKLSSCVKSVFKGEERKELEVARTPQERCICHDLYEMDFPPDGVGTDMFPIVNKAEKEVFGESRLYLFGS